MMGIFSAIKRVFTRGFYEGGKVTKANRDFYNATAPFEDTAQPDRDRMRARARWLAANNPIMANVDDAIVNNVVGTGIRIISNTGRKKLDKVLTDRFNAYMDSTAIDSDGKRTGFDLQSLWLRSRMVDGEIFIYKRFTEDGLKIQTIEADALYEIVKKDGIITDYVFRVGELGSMETITIPAENIINYYKAERVTQDRGVTEYKQAIVDIKNFSAYQSAVIKSARARAAIAYTVESEGKPAHMGAYRDDDDNMLQTINGVMVYYLRKGEKLNKQAGQAGGEDYKSFVETTIRLMATARKVSYELAFKDYSKVNFASSRASLIQDNYRFDLDQAHLTKYVLIEIYKAWIENEILLNRIKIPITRFKDDPLEYVNVSWSFPTRSWVDPLKDMLAIEKEFALGLTTKSDLAQKRGRTYEDILKARKHDRELEVEYGEPQLNADGEAKVIDSLQADFAEIDFNVDDVDVDKIKSILDKYGI